MNGHTRYMIVDDAVFNEPVFIAEVTKPADASLIAAAPELLAAAKNARNVLAALATGDLKEINADSHALALLRTAIEKAEGR
jgi:hypothetical protein